MGTMMAFLLTRKKNLVHLKENLKYPNFPRKKGCQMTKFKKFWIPRMKILRLKNALKKLLKNLKNPRDQEMVLILKIGNWQVQNRLQRSFQPKKCQKWSI